MHEATILIVVLNLAINVPSICVVYYLLGGPALPERLRVGIM